MLQCVALCCSVLQCVAVCCSVLQCVAVRCTGNELLQESNAKKRAIVEKYLLVRPDRNFYRKETGICKRVIVHVGVTA